MALYDRRTLDVGAHSVRQSVIYIQNYRYAEERMMRMMAGYALHTDALGKRLPELRAQPQVSKPANEAFVTFMNAIEDKEEWEETIERLVGIYRVLKPHLISHYSSHLSAMNPVYEPPTLRILQRLVEEEKGHVERGSVLLNELLDSKEKHERAAKWQSHLEGLLGASGGVTGFEAEAEAPRRKVGRS
jgi:hypothetical protein